MEDGMGPQSLFKDTAIGALEPVLFKGSGSLVNIWQEGGKWVCASSRQSPHTRKLSQGLGRLQSCPLLHRRQSSPQPAPLPTLKSNAEVSLH